MEFATLVRNSRMLKFASEKIGGRVRVRSRCADSREQSTPTNLRARERGERYKTGYEPSANSRRRRTCGLMDQR